MPHLRTRLPANALLLRLRSQVIASLTEFFGLRDYVQAQPPIITSSDCEGAGETFAVTTLEKASGRKKYPAKARYRDDFFKTPKFLTVSSQLHLETLVPSVGRVWTLSPTFRAEKSDTPRHLSEFYMLEAEMSLGTEDSIHSITTLVEDMLGHVIVRLRESRVGQDLLSSRDFDLETSNPDGLLSAAELESRWNSMSQNKTQAWTRLSYKEAVKALCHAAESGRHFDFKPELGAALQVEHEKYLASHIGEGSPVFVTDYPMEVKAFYMSPGSRIDEQGATLETADCFDLLVPDICELAGGSLREHRLPELLENMKRHGLIGTAVEPEVPPSLKWYTDLRRYGSVPHGGFGLGFDRLLSYLSGIPNVRDVVAFPRWYRRCDC